MRWFHVVRAEESGRKSRIASLRGREEAEKLATLFREVKGWEVDVEEARPSDFWCWGAEDKSELNGPFDSVALQGGRTLDLYQGVHPHSRQDHTTYGVDRQFGTIWGFNGHRRIVRVEIESYNYIKSSSFSGSEIRRGGEGRILIDGQEVDSFFFRDPVEALLMARERLIKTLEPIGPKLWNDEVEVGRRVYYNDQPAVIEDIDVECNRVFVVPDGPDSFRVPAYALEEGESHEWVEEYGRGLWVRADSDNLWWWRTAPAG